MTRIFTHSNPGRVLKAIEAYDYSLLGEKYNHDERMKHLNYLTEEYSYSKKYFIGLLIRSVEENNTAVSQVLFDHFDVPDDLTLKEKICYIQLLGDL